MQRLQQQLRVVQARQQRQWLGQCLSWGLIAGGVIGCFGGLARLLGDAVGWEAVAGPVLAGPVLGALYASLKSRPLRAAAVATDQRYGLQDRMTTAWSFLTHGTPDTPWQALQVADAETHLEGVDPREVAPYRTPRSLPAGLILSLGALLLGYLSTSAPPVVAAAVSNDVVVAQANRAADELAKLEEFQQEEADPLVEELMQQLARKIEELRQPGIDPKEALAKLSEMEAALQAQQMQLSSQQTDAQLKAVGDALSLAEELQAAGQAMSEGKLEEAAEHLMKLQDLPKVDRQTEKALTEKLQQLAKNSGSGAPRQLQEALQQLSMGLGQGNASQFHDGLHGLAGECRKQARRTRLADLLRKQCQCLSECKSECEGQCQKPGSSNKKGGKNWGLASSGNEPGDKSARLNSPHQMNITGQESNEGDVDIETEQTPEARQEAVRQYREKVDKYQQLSESVLDSEPIPLGHRQTIRRYFELIRPAAAEVDAVSQQLDAPVDP